MHEQFHTWFIEAKHIKRLSHRGSPCHHTCLVFATIIKCLDAGNDSQILINPSIPGQNTAWHQVVFHPTEMNEVMLCISSLGLPASFKTFRESLLYLWFRSNVHSEGWAECPSLRGIEGILRLVELIQVADLEYSSNTLVHCWENWKQHLKHFQI